MLEIAFFRINDNNEMGSSVTSSIDDGRDLRDLPTFHLCGTSNIAVLDAMAGASLRCVPRFTGTKLVDVRSGCL